MLSQPDLLTDRPPAAENDIATLTAHLSRARWQTRFQLRQALNWTNRRIRETAELMGADIVRCQSGFLLTNQITRDTDDFRLALQAADAAASQATKMQTYSLALRKRLHALIH